MISSLSQDETRALLSQAGTGRLGCVVAGCPYVVPVNYVYHDDSIYVHSLPARKALTLRANPRACLQVDEIGDACHWRSAIAFGRYQEVTDDSERRGAVGRLLSRFPDLTPVESVPVHDGQSSVIIFCIRVEEMTGVGKK